MVGGHAAGELEGGLLRLGAGIAEEHALGEGLRDELEASSRAGSLVTTFETCQRRASGSSLERLTNAPGGNGPGP